MSGGGGTGTNTNTTSESSSSSFRPLIDLCDAPRVLIRHADGGYMQRSSLPHWPYRYQETRDPDTNFILIPVERVVKKDWEEEDDKENDSKESEVDFNIVSLWQFVAIGYKEKNGTISFLSCRRDHLGVGVSWVRPVTKLDRYEVFQVERCFHENTFVFQAHNHQYLHYNKITHTLEFHSKVADKAKWHVHFVDAGHETKQVLYVGILSLSDNAAKLEPRESVTADQQCFDKEYFNDVLRVLKNEVAPSRSFIFPDPLFLQQQWFVKTDADMNMYILITALDYPKWVAIQCIDEMEGMYKRLLSSREKDYKVLHERLAKYLYATRLYYDDVETLQKNVDLDPEIAALVRKMEENINEMLSNMENADSLKSKGEDLLAQAQIFKKKTSQLRRGGRDRWLLPAVFAATGAAIGGTTGFLVGGPGAAAILGTELAEIGAGVGLGLLPALFYTAGAHGSFFWENTVEPVQSLGKVKKQAAAVAATTARPVKV